MLRVYSVPPSMMSGLPQVNPAHGSTMCPLLPGFGVPEMRWSALVHANRPGDSHRTRSDHPHSLAVVAVRRPSLRRRRAIRNQRRLRFALAKWLPIGQSSAMLQSLSTARPEGGPAIIPTGRLLIVNIGRLGDTILRNAILDSAFRTFAEVDYLCGRHNFELLRHDKRLRRLIVFRKSAGGLATLAKAIVGGRYEAVVDLKCHPSSTSLILATLFRGRLKTGANRGWMQPFQRDARSIIEPGLPVTEMMRRLSRLAGWAEGAYQPSLVLPEDSREWFRQNHTGLRRPFILINISATKESRTWPLKYWAEYVRGCGLAQQPLLINGAPQDRELVRQLCAELPGATAFQPRSFMDVVAAVEAAQLVFTVDTGVVHICSALDKPIVALFGTSNTANSYQPLSTWRLSIRPRNGRWVPDIRPEEAIEATRQHGLPAPF